jgi:hypothetical protein
MSEREVTEQGDQFGTIVHGAGTGPYMLKTWTTTWKSTGGFPGLLARRSVH